MVWIGRKRLGEILRLIKDEAGAVTIAVGVRKCRLKASSCRAARLGSH